LSAPTTQSAPHPAEWIPVGIEVGLLALLGLRYADPAFLRGQLLPSLALGLAPGTALRICGKPSLSAHRVGVAVGLVTFMFTNGVLDLRALERTMGHRDLLLAGVGLVLMQPVFHALRWGLLLRAQEIRLSYTERLRLILVGTFFNSFVPGATGGDVFRAYYVARGREEAEAAVTSVVLDRFLGLPPLLLILAVAGVLHWGFVAGTPTFHPVAWLGAGAVLACGIIVLLLVWLASRGEGRGSGDAGSGTWTRMQRALAAYRTRGAGRRG